MVHGHIGRKNLVKGDDLMIQARIRSPAGAMSESRPEDRGSYAQWGSCTLPGIDSSSIITQK